MSSTAPDLLSALQLGDTFFPSGAYALSHGLETAVEEKRVTSAADVERWLRAQIAFQVGPGDAVALAAVWSAAEGHDVATIVAVDCHLDVFRLAREPREASIRMGRRLLITAGRVFPETAQSSAFGDYREVVDAHQSPGHQAIALGVVAQSLGIGRSTTITVLLHSFATGVLGAALRLVRMDHEESQVILHRLGPLLRLAVENSLSQSWTDLWTATPEVEISAMRHERATRRLFMT